MVEPGKRGLVAGQRTAIAARPLERLIHVGFQEEYQRLCPQALAHRFERHGPAAEREHLALRRHSVEQGNDRFLLQLPERGFTLAGKYIADGPAGLLLDYQVRIKKRASQQSAASRPTAVLPLPMKPVRITLEANCS